jgi:hypothetical protein
MRLATGLFLILLAACSGPRIMLCEQSQHRLALIEADADWSDPDALAWQWQAADSPEIKPEHRAWFRHPTDAKPVLDGDYVLMTASGGAVALIRLEDKATVFYAKAAGNPHSAEWMPDGAIVTASSTGNMLELWRVDYRNSPIQAVELPSAHGVCWDPKRELLWVIGLEKLYCFRYHGIDGFPPLEYVRDFDLPGHGGHDLQRRALDDDLVLSTEDGVWVFQPLIAAAPAVNEPATSGKFHPHPQIGDWLDVKSISEAPKSAPSGLATLVVKAEEQWWSPRVYGADSIWQRELPQSRNYKARWWFTNTSKPKFQPRLTIGIGIGGFLGVDPD